MHPSYYHCAHMCILCFDVTRKSTYKNLNKWFKELRSYRKGIPVILLANKIDLEMKATKKKFKFAKDNKLPFYFVSAAEGTNVVRVFNEGIKMAIGYKGEPKDDYFEEVYQLLQEEHLGEGPPPLPGSDKGEKDKPD